MRAFTNIDKKENEALALYRNDAFDIGFYQYFIDLERNKISEILNNRERNVKLDTVTYRQLNSWEKEGLLTNGREGREWRRFNIIDAIWVRIIKELRDFGMGWEQLKITKQSLEFENAKCGVSMPLLEFYIAFAIGNKMPVLLLVFKDGVAVPANFSQYKIASEFKSIENHLQINLNKILQSFFPNVDLKPKHKGELPLDIDEMELLAFLRLGNYEKVEITYKSGKMITAEGMQRIDTNNLVSDVIKEHKYQKIEVVVEDGKKISLRRTIKKQLNKKG
jgi:DNA-binding transcriptional MerR regulator